MKLRNHSFNEAIVRIRFIGHKSLVAPAQEKLKTLYAEGWLGVSNASFSEAIIMAAHQVNISYQTIFPMHRSSDWLSNSQCESSIYTSIIPVSVSLRHQGTGIPLNVELAADATTTD